MVSARSTVSIARTTPAQKPRGEQSTILRSGLADIGAISGPNHPSPVGGERPIRIRTWDCFRALSRRFSRPLRQYPGKAYKAPNSPSSPMTTDFASERGGRGPKEICHEQCTADAKGDGRVAG